MRGVRLFPEHVVISAFNRKKKIYIYIFPSFLMSKIVEKIDSGPCGFKLFWYNKRQFLPNGSYFLNEMWCKALLVHWNIHKFILLLKEWIQLYESLPRVNFYINCKSIPLKDTKKSKTYSFIHLLGFNFLLWWHSRSTQQFKHVIKKKSFFSKWMLI